ncbi:MAG: hypothetical protein JWP76_958, partial [Dactylosporangium sp.]|nr:hypothetical protein [Dactylosporangium sp.]
MASPLRRFLAATATTIAVTTASVLVGFAAPAQARPTPRPHSTMRYQEHNDTSAPLRSMAPVPVGTAPRPTDSIPHMPQQPVAHRADPVVQTSMSAAAPTPSASFDGLGQGFSGPQGSFSVTGVPPDPNAAVGANQIVEVVNTGVAVFSKTGATLYGPA